MYCNACFLSKFLYDDEPEWHLKNSRSLINGFCLVYFSVFLFILFQFLNTKSVFRSNTWRTIKLITHVLSRTSFIFLVKAILSTLPNHYFTWFDSYFRVKYAMFCSWLKKWCFYWLLVMSFTHIVAWLDVTQNWLSFYFKKKRQRKQRQITNDKQILYFGLT